MFSVVLDGIDFFTMIREMKRLTIIQKCHRLGNINLKNTVGELIRGVLTLAAHFKRALIGELTK